MTTLFTVDDQAPSRSRIRICVECDLVSDVPPLAAGERSRCPRCGHRLATRMFTPIDHTLAYAIAAVIMLALSLSFSFISFSSTGVEQSMHLVDAITVTLEQRYGFLSFCFLVGVLALPFVYLTLVIYLHVSLALDHRPPGGVYIARSLSRMQPWVMADIFIVGVLVSLVKIMSLATISFGPAFWAFCIFSLLLLTTTQSVDRDWLFKRMCGPILTPEPEPGRGALTQGFTSCHACGQPGRVDDHGKGRCQRCGEALHARTKRSVQLTMALVVTSIILYIPSMALPVMIITQFGHPEPQTIIGGVLLLLAHGDYPVALVIFFASVTVPVAKVMALTWLCWKTRRPEPFRPGPRMKLYRLTEFIGRWSMIDVFVVTVLAAMVQLGNLMNIVPGHGVVAFGLVVVLTMIAAMCFDPRLLWDATNLQQTGQRHVAPRTARLSPAPPSSRQEVTR